MRWTSKHKPPPPEIGDTRTYSGFLWLPKTIGDETRWLCRGAWEEKLMKYRVVPFPDRPMESYGRIGFLPTSWIKP